jgi:hypothetical protein
MGLVAQSPTNKNKSPAMEPTHVDTIRLSSSHPSGDLLENYALGLLSEPELARVETHLFVCQECQDALVETDNYLAAMKAVLAEPVAQPAPSRWAAFTGMIGESLRFSHPIPAFSAAVTALALAAALTQSYAPNLSAREADVALRSVRGGLENVESLGPSHTRLNLKIQSQHLRVDETFRAQIVDAAGDPAWTGTPQLNREEGFSLHVDKPLNAGSYWVRLYDPQQKLLQEYGLKLQ